MQLQLRGSFDETAKRMLVLSATCGGMSWQPPQLTAGGQSVGHIFSTDLQLFTKSEARCLSYSLLGVCCRRPYDEGFQQQPATELSVWQRMLPLLCRL